MRRFDLEGGLQDGQDYAFNMFFAEAHTSQSNFRIDTSLPFVIVPEPSTWAASAGSRRRRAG